MRLRLWRWQPGCPKLRPVEKGARRDTIEHARGNPNIGNADPPAMKPSGKQHMAKLSPKEGDRVRSFHGRAHYRASRALDSARQVNCVDARLGIHCRDEFARWPLHRPVKAGAEQRIDEHFAAKRASGGTLRAPLPALCRECGIAFQARTIAKEQDAHPVAALMQRASRNKPVTAVVSAACDHGHARTGGVQRW